MKPKGETLSLIYDQRFKHITEYRDLVWQILCTCFFNKFIPENSKCLDLGAGYGEFINHITCGEKLAMDLNPTTRDHLHKGIQFMQQDCSAVWSLDPDYLDIIFTSNFFEHLPDKDCIERTIYQCHRCLKNDGLFICLGPNIKYIPGAYWDFWDHHIPLTESCLAEILKINGFDIEQLFPRFLPHSMSTGFSPPRFLIKLYLKLPLLWPLFGKQFLIIARKNS